MANSYASPSIKKNYCIPLTVQHTYEAIWGDDEK